MHDTRNINKTPMIYRVSCGQICYPSWWTINYIINFFKLQYNRRWIATALIRRSIIIMPYVRTLACTQIWCTRATWYVRMTAHMQICVRVLLGVYVWLRTCYNWHMRKSLYACLLTSRKCVAESFDIKQPPYILVS